MNDHTPGPWGPIRVHRLIAPAPELLWALGALVARAQEESGLPVGEIGEEWDYYSAEEDL